MWEETRENSRLSVGCWQTFPRTIRCSVQAQNRFSTRSPTRQLCIFGRRHLPSNVHGKYFTKKLGPVSASTVPYRNVAYSLCLVSFHAELMTLGQKKTLRFGTVRLEWKMGIIDMSFLRRTTVHCQLWENGQLIRVLCDSSSVHKQKLVKPNRLLAKWRPWKNRD